MSGLGHEPLSEPTAEDKEMEHSDWAGQGHVSTSGVETWDQSGLSPRTESMEKGWCTQLQREGLAGK